AVEGMSAGLAVIANLEDRRYTLPFRRWAFLDECPIVSGSPETIVDVLRELVTRPELRRQLASANRAYAEKYHSMASAQFLFGNVIAHLTGEPVDLLNLYHPHKGTYALGQDRIEHPLQE